MGMTITDNIDFLNEAKKFYEEIANNPSLNETIKTYFTIESLESAINIMHKYQKIQEIVEQKDYDRFNSHNYYGYFLRVQDIRKVIEDGKFND